MSLDPDILEAYGKDRALFLDSLSPSQRERFERLKAAEAVAERADLLRAFWVAMAGGVRSGELHSRRCRLPAGTPEKGNRPRPNGAA